MNAKTRETVADAVKKYLNEEISAGKLIELVPEKRDLVGGFANVIDQQKRDSTRVRYGVEQAISAIGNLESAISQLQAALKSDVP